MNSPDSTPPSISCVTRLRRWQRWLRSGASPTRGMKTVAMCVAAAFFEIWGDAGLPDNG